MLLLRLRAPSSMAASVDLPPPDGPTSATVLPGARSRLMPSRVHAVAPRGGIARPQTAPRQTPCSTAYQQRALRCLYCCCCCCCCC